MKNFALLGLLLCALFGPEVSAQYKFDNVLYGASFYNEYMPTERLDEDIRLMKQAGVSSIRVGESTWAVIEPQEGVYNFEWMDRVLDELHKAGIKVIYGTPTYSVPAWLFHKHPEILAKHVQGGQAYYGYRQNMDITNPTYKYYCERIIRKVCERYAQHPAVIGFQVDNEVEARGINNHDHFVDFRNHVKNKFGGDIAKLNKEWGLNYWGMNINTWEEFYTRDGVTSPSYKNEWERYYRVMLADFLNWQCDIVKEYIRSDQFVTHDFMTAFQNLDQIESCKQMDYPGVNVYHAVQDYQDGQLISYAGDFMRQVGKSGNYMVMETNAQGIAFGDSRGQNPPYDGQLRQNLYSHLASGANLVYYWHWTTLHYGHETYWKGILGHDMTPNRVYNEFSVTAHELEQIGPKLVNLKKNNKAAILFSHDSYHALEFIRYKDWNNYQVYDLHKALFQQNIEVDILSCDKVSDFSKYDMLVIPSLYVATDELLNKIDQFVRDGGHVVMMLKSGYMNEYSAVRPTLAPGSLRKAAGIHYQEFANIGNLPLKGDPFGVGEDNNVFDWYEFLIPETATPLAYADHPFFGKWPVITENNYGKGKLTYIGTNPSQKVLQKIIRKVALESKVITEEKVTFPVILRSGTNDQGHKLDYVFNYSDKDVTVKNNIAEGKDLLTDTKYNLGDEIHVQPWGVAILESKK